MRRSTMMRTAAVAGAALAGALALGGVSHAATAPAQSTGGYQFASNYQSGAKNVWQVSGSPISQPTASETLAGNGVGLVAGNDSATPPDYTSAAVIVDLGRLSGLFNTSGTYVPPAITGSTNLLYNLYFDTNGNGTYLSFSYNGFYQGPDGDNLASLGTENNTNDQADFSTFTQGNTSIGLSGQMSMENVRAKYLARTDGGTTDPEVWAWVGVQNSPSATSGHVSSVAGKALTETASATGEISSFVNYSASCLDNSNYTWANGNPLQLWKCGAAGGVNQQFRIVAFSDGSSQLQAVAPSGSPQGPWCVTAGALSTDRLTIQACGNGTGHQDVIKSGSYYEFAGTSGPLVMDDAGFGTANGNPINAHVLNGGKNQQWSLP